jgi:hypothetical protein
MIVSEQDAEQVGEYITGGKHPVAFTVFTYEHKPSRLTAFGVQLPTGTTITADPRAAAPRKTTGE